MLLLLLKYVPKRCEFDSSQLSDCVADCQHECLSLLQQKRMQEMEPLLKLCPH